MPQAELLGILVGETQRGTRITPEEGGKLADSSFGYQHNGLETPGAKSA